MKNLLSILIIAVLFTGCTNKKPISETQKNKENLPKIAILGTFHFGNTNDYSSVKIDSILSQRRQEELDDLVAKIKLFKPTKIMVEWEPNTKEELDAELSKYYKGNFKLHKNEIYQIAFRLAKEMNIKEFFPIDYQMDLGDEKLMNYLKETNSMDTFQKLLTEIQDFAAAETEFLKTNTLTRFFIKMNTNENVNYYRNLYLETFQKVSNESGNPFLEYTANWYKRNIFIMKLIDNQVEKNDRILVIIGAGHKSILKDLYANRSTIDYVEINEYLTK